MANHLKREDQMESHYRKEFAMEPITLSSLAKRYGLEQRGEDRKILSMGMLTHRTRFRQNMLSFAITPSYVQAFAESDVGACVIADRMSEILPSDRTALITDADPEEIFYSIFSDLAEEKRWPSLESSTGENNSIANTAVIHHSVQIGTDCVIMDNVVILPNTRLGNGVVIKPNSTIGGYGWESRTIRGRRRIPPHVGGVWIRDGVQVGSGNCIDKGMFGDFTLVGAETLMDNLVHVGHSCTIGPRCKLTACVEISGYVVLGDNTWLGPNTSITNHVTIGANCFVGIGSNVVRSLPAHSLAYGNPARRHGWVCECRQQLDFEGDIASCPRCCRKYSLAEGNRLISGDETTKTC